MPKLGDPCPVSNAHSALLGCLLSLHFLGFTSQEPQLSSAPQLLCQPGGVGTINRSPQPPRKTKGSRGILMKWGLQGGMAALFACSSLRAPHSPLPPAAAVGSGMLKRGRKATSMVYLSLFPLRFQVTWDRQEGVQGTPRAGPLAWQGV